MFNCSLLIYTRDPSALRMQQWEIKNGQTKNADTFIKYYTCMLSLENIKIM